jgi:hypothetical protein
VPLSFSKLRLLGLIPKALAFPAISTLGLGLAF